MKKEESKKSKEDTKEIIDFRSAVGRFVESYLDQLLKRAFVNYKHCVLKTLEGLQTERKDAEVADFYLRFNKKILIGEVKSGSINDEKKFGGNPDLLYKNDPEDFFNYFGLNKMVERIKNLKEKFLPFDTKLPLGHTLTIYPCIVINDKVFQTFFWADIFNKRFQKLLEETDRRKLNIKPLRLMHISDFERMEVHLINNPNAIWNLLSYNGGENKFIFPFNRTFNKYCYKNNIRFNSSSMSNDLFIDLYSKYKPRPIK